MGNYQEFKKASQSLRKDKKYQEALNVYSKLWTDYRDECDLYDGWGYAYVLRSLNKSNEALNICREVYKMDNGFELNNNLYAWCIYDLYINVDVVQEKEFFKGAKAIIELCKQDKYSPYAKTVFRVINYIEKKSKPEYADIIEWLSLLDPNELDELSPSFTDSSGKVIKKASEKENFYAQMSKALFEINNYDKCIQVSRDALNKCAQFHYSNDVWFKRRIGLSKMYLGEFDEALKILSEVYLLKQDWFVAKEIGDVYLKMKDMEKAKEKYLDAALGFGERRSKVNLYEAIYNLYRDINKEEIAKKHLELALVVRKENGWQLTNEFKKLLSENAIDQSTEVSAYDLEKELRSLWEKEKFNSKVIYYGNVTKIIADGKSGFILGENGNSYYFRISSVKGNKSYISEGKKVGFYLEKGFDKKKNTQTDIAVNIFVVKS